MFQHMHLPRGLLFGFVRAEWTTELRVLVALVADMEGKMAPVFVAPATFFAKVPFGHITEGRT